jgi:hypothetical protein
MDDLWFGRDLPVLEFVAQAMQDPANVSGIRFADISSSTGIAVEQVFLSVRALEDEGYLKAAWIPGGPGAGRVTRVYGAGLRAAGAWPEANVLGRRLIDQLRAVADAEPDEGRRSRLKAAASALGETLLGTGENVAAAVVLRMMGMG